MKTTFESVLQSYGRGDWKGACVYAERFLLENPNHAGALAILGASCASENDHKQAVEHFRAALQLVTEKTALLLALARSLSVLDDWKSVAEAILCLPAKPRQPIVASTDYDWALPMSHKLINHDHIDAANRLLTQLTVVHPERFEAWCLLGLGSAKVKAWKEAVGFFEHALRINPSHSFSEWHLACCYLNLGWMTRAKDNLLRLTARADAPIESFEALADLAAAEGAVSEAIQWLEKAVQRSPKAEKLHRRLVELCLAAGLLERAETYINAARGVVADPVWILVLRCHILEARGETQDALELAKTLAQRFPRHPAPSLMQIKLLTDRGEFQQAKLLIDRTRVGHETDAQDKFLQAQVRFYRVQYEFDVVKRLIDAAPDQASTHVMTLRLMNAIDRGLINEAKRLARLLDDQDLVRSHRDAAKDALTSAFQVMLDELGSNGSAVERLASIVRQPVSKRASHLCEAMNEEPGYLGFPVMLLRTLRQSGTLGKHRPKGLEGIPRTIMQFWDRPDIPEDVCALMQSWIEHNPTWDYECFDDVTAQQFIATHYDADLVHTYKTCSTPALKADLFRLAYLYQCGGVYADCDDKCQDALEGLVEPGYSLIVQQEIGSTIGNNLIGVAPRHPFVKNALARVASSILERQGDNIRFVSGPGIFTQAFCQTYAAQFARSSLPAGVKVLCPHDLAAFVAQHLPCQYKADAPHWRNRGKMSLASHG